MSAGGPPAKRLRHEAPVKSLTVPKDVLERIKKNLAVPELVPLDGACFVLSWNIDGIDEADDTDRMLRALAVAEHIASTKPVAVLLQEVIPPQLELLLAPQVLGAHYDIVCPENPTMPYYCVILLHKKRVRISSQATKHFPTSRMGRHLLMTDVVIDGRDDAPLTLSTTHLESTKSEKTERMKQLVDVFRTLSDIAAHEPRTVILAGDLNIRDDEMLSARTQASAHTSNVNNFVDAWVWCGSPKSEEFTWDTTLNTNVGASYSSRLRFDRCLFASHGVTEGCGAKKKMDGKVQVVPMGSPLWRATSFQLVGRAKVNGLGRFPSDHWGIQVGWAAGERSSQGMRACGSTTTSTNAQQLLGSGSSSSIAHSPTLTKDVEHAHKNMAEEERMQRRERAAKSAELRMSSSQSSLSSAPNPSPSCKEESSPAQVSAGLTSSGDQYDSELAQAIALSLASSASPTTASQPARAGIFANLPTCSSKTTELD